MVCWGQFSLAGRSADRESRFSAIVLQRLTPSRATLTGERLRNGNSRPANES